MKCFVLERNTKGKDSDFHQKIERRCASLQHSVMPSSRPDKTARLFAILHLIEIHSDDLELSAVTAARQLGVTPRYVHLLLRRTGKSFTRHLLETRLQNAAALLRDPL